MTIGSPAGGLSICGLLVLLLCPALGQELIAQTNSSCLRVPWFMGVRSPPEQPEETNGYLDYLAVALMSAKARAPSLVPFLLFDGPPCNFTAWFQAQGGTVVFHSVSFLDLIMRDVEQLEITDKGWVRIVRGAYMRIDIPLVLQELDLPPDASRDTFLYTDSDVMFLQDFSTCSLPAPALYYMGAEHHKGTIANSGVLYMNTTAMWEHREGMLAFQTERHWNYRGIDQALLMDYFKELQVDLLPDELNWKSYWGANPDAAILHFHGYKPFNGMACFVANPESWRVACEHVPPVYHLLYKQAHKQDRGKYVRTMLFEFLRYLAQTPRAHRLAEFPMWTEGLPVE